MKTFIEQTTMCFCFRKQQEEIVEVRGIIHAYLIHISNFTGPEVNQFVPGVDEYKANIREACNQIERVYDSMCPFPGHPNCLKIDDNKLVPVKPKRFGIIKLFTKNPPVNCDCSGKINQIIQLSELISRNLDMYVPRPF